MPLYEYECRKHGVFERLGGVAERAAPQRCPDCSRRAPRVLSATRAPALERGARIAHERNERSQHEPRVSSRSAVEPSRERQPAKLSPQRVHAGARPWMIGH